MLLSLAQTLIFGPDIDLQHSGTADRDSIGSMTEIRPSTHELVMIWHLVALNVHVGHWRTHRVCTLQTQLTTVSCFSLPSSSPIMSVVTPACL